MTRRILVTDDNSHYRQDIIELLQFEGFEVIEAADGREALETVKKEKPDLILCDIDMPVMDGFAVLEALKADNELARIPFILVSGRTDTESIRRGNTLGADDYITKPMNIETLLQKIQQHLPDDQLPDQTVQEKE